MNRPGHLQLSIILPALNEAANLPAVLSDAQQVIAQAGLVAEILVVDDGSLDGTVTIAQSFASSQSDVSILCIQHESNRGYGAALRSGFRHASGDFIFFTDADRQFRFAQVPEFIAAIGDHDCVTGYRRHRCDPWYRVMNSAVGNLLARTALGVKARDINCAHKLFRRNLIQQLPLKSEGALINTEILAFAARHRWTVKELPVRHYPRLQGCPTGANPRVILKTFAEYFSLRSHIQSPRSAGSNNPQRTISRLACDSELTPLGTNQATAD